MIFMTPRTGLEKGQGTWGMWGCVGLGCHFEGGLVTRLGVLRGGRGCHPRFSGVQNGEGEAASAVASAGEVDDVGGGQSGYRTRHMDGYLVSGVMLLPVAQLPR